MSSDPTLNELDALLAEIGVDAGARGITVAEVSVARGISIPKARDLLRPLVHAGKLRVEMVTRGPKDGPQWLRESKVQGYVVV